MSSLSMMTLCFFVLMLTVYRADAKSLLRKISSPDDPTLTPRDLPNPDARAIDPDTTRQSPGVTKDPEAESGSGGGGGGGGIGRREPKQRSLKLRKIGRVVGLDRDADDLSLIHI